MSNRNDSLAMWNEYFDAFRAENPHMKYRDAQRACSEAFQAQKQIGGGLSSFLKKKRKINLPDDRPTIIEPITPERAISDKSLLSMKDLYILRKNRWELPHNSYVFVLAKEKGTNKNLLILMTHNNNSATFKLGKDFTHYNPMDVHWAESVFGPNGTIYPTLDTIQTQMRQFHPKYSKITRRTIMMDI
jgi:hypothetical protein